VALHTTAFHIEGAFHLGVRMVARSARRLGVDGRLVHGAPFELQGCLVELLREEALSSGFVAGSALSTGGFHVGRMVERNVPSGLPLKISGLAGGFTCANTSRAPTSKNEKTATVKVAYAHEHDHIPSEGAGGNGCGTREKGEGRRR
jgi:hypothetical protein